MNRKKRKIGLVVVLILSMLVTLFADCGIIMVQAATSFTPRLSAPDSSNEYYYSNKNIFYANGWGMPNCTAYAYGRAYELLGTAPKVSTGNAGKWWTYNKDKGYYSYGSTPKLGAIAVWDQWDNNQGHVAVVEAIDGNNVTISESHYGGTIFNTRTIKADSSNYLTSWRFNGYIYIGDFESKHYDNPSVAGTYWGNQTDTTFRPVAVINNPDTVKEVRFAVWTTSDQSDLKWYDANYNGAGGYFKDINFSDFTNKIFICHVYIYGRNGSVQSMEMERLDTNDYSKPNIDVIYWGNQTDTTFRPVIVINNPESVEEVRFAVWTTGDQSDLQWYDANYNGVSGYFKDINFSDFQGQRFFCHGYVYGKDGSTQSIALNSFDTYNAQGEFESAVGNIGSITVTGYAFDKSNKAESISLHCYLKDSAGNATFLGVAPANEERTDVNSKYSVGNYHGFSTTFITSLYGTYTVEVSAMNIGGGNDVTFLGSKTVTIAQPIVYFDSCGGTQCASVKIVNGETYGNLPIPLRTGYTFEGWYTAKTGGQKITEDTIAVLTSNQTLYAHWKCNHNYQATITKAATCTGEGSKKFACSTCGNSYNEVIPSIGHGYETVVTDPTCEESGYSMHTCSRCGDSYVDGEREALGHELGKWVTTKEATCEKAGEAQRSCDRCEHVETKVISATGHGYETVVTAPTCEETGYSTHTCKVCGEGYVDRETEALGHKFGEWVTIKEATCEEVGEEQRNCDRCGYAETKVISATGHTYETAVTAPTCEESGYSTHACSRCGDSYVDGEREALGHELGKWVTTKEATCEKAGEAQRSCERCEYVETKPISATGHTYETVVTESTCEKVGYSTHTCNACGDSYVDSEVEALGHELGEWTTTKEAGCEEAGGEKRSCERCNHFETKEVPATGHAYEEEVTEPTCEESGYTTHTCSVCGDSYADSEVEALGHKLGEWTTTKETTCEEAGEEQSSCDRCGYVETKVISATGHTYETAVTAPTCEESGYSTHTCSVCGDSYVDSETEALGHSFTNYISDNNATTDSAGTLTAKCDRCDATDTIPDPAGPIVPEIPKNDEVIRLSGTTRYETGYKVADVLKERLGVAQFDAIVIATGKNFADALSGSYLAVVKNAPIILTNGKDDNIAKLHDYIKENVAEGGKVYILGGTGAVPASVEEIEGYDVVRLSGPTRYDTNLAILEEAGIAGDELIVATGKSFADSLSASAAKLPILLVKPGKALNDEAKAVIEGMNKIYIIGGEGAVSKDIEDELAVYGEVERVFGKSRYETSIAVANTFFEDIEEVVIASGKNFPDGLCGGPLAAVMDVPLILTADGKTSAAVDYIQGESVESGFILGGTGAIGDDSVVEIIGLESADEIILK